MGGAGERLAGAHALAQLAEEIRGCTRCPPASHRTPTVSGEGNVLSDVTLVGEAGGARPGAVHGRLRRAEAGRHISPMYHPAAALHQASLRDTPFGDFRGLPAAFAGRSRDTERGARAIGAGKGADDGRGGDGGSLR